MNYLEIIARALKGRSVNKAAKEWGIPQKTLDMYAKANRLPPYDIAKKIADEAGVNYDETFKALAKEAGRLKSQRGFVQTMPLTALAIVAYTATLYIILC